MQQWGSRSAAAFGARAGEALRVLNDCFGQPVAQASPFASAAPSPVPTVPVGKGGSRAQKWDVILQRQKTNRKPEWICSTCLSSNWLKQTQCRGCDKDARGWLLVPKGTPPTGPPKAGKSWQSTPARPDGPALTGKGKGSSRHAKDVPTPQSPPAGAAVPAIMEVDVEWEDMSRQELQSEQARLLKSLESLGCGTHTQAIRDIIQKELDAIERALVNKRSTGQRLDMAEAALRKACTALEKAESKVQTLMQQLEDAKADVVYHASAKQSAQAAVEKIRLEYSTTPVAPPPQTTLSGVANQMWDLIQQDPRMVSVEVLESLMKGLSTVPVDGPERGQAPVTPVPNQQERGTTAATQLDPPTQEAVAATQQATAQDVAQAHATEAARQEKARRDRSRSPK